jgi:chemotaxis protein MotB
MPRIEADEAKLMNEHLTGGGAGPRRRARRIGGRGARGSHGEPHDRWLVSYADLVTLLLALFILLYATADAGRARAVAEALRAQFGAGEDDDAAATAGRGVLPGADSLAETQAAFERAVLASASLRGKARVGRDARGVFISLTEAGFFAPGVAEVRDAESAAAVDALAAVLRESSAPIRVEGHTDSQPISTPRYPSNWELSAARGASVLARLAAAGVPEGRMSVAGFAGERPVAGNETQEGRALNRRVDIVVLGQN